MAGLTKRCCSKCGAVRHCIDTFELIELTPINGKGILELRCIECNTSIEKHEFIKK